jgi:hypothetical protein
VKGVAITAAAVLALSALSGCPSPPDKTSLWLAPNNSEVVIKLIDHEPPPW